MKIYNIQGVEILDVQVDDSSVRYRSIMSDDSLTLKFSHTAPVSVPVGSYVDFEGQRYTLWLPENFKKHSTRNFEYTIALGGWREALKLFKFKDMSSTPYRLKFSLTAKPIEFLQLLVDNMNIHDSGWTVGSYIDAVERTLSFNHEYCFDVLARIAQEWTTEFEFESKKIHLRKVEKFKDAPLALSYGKGNGFKSGVGRANDGDNQPIGRLYVQGGERNIDFSTYGSSSLLLPKSQILVYEDKTYRTDADGMYITRDGNDLLAEDSFDANHIYPKRVGTVSEIVIVDAEKHFYDIKDASIPESLDYSACRIDGEKATISFQSGALSGREFDIEQTDKSLTGYIHAERRFKIVPQELDGIVMPGGAFVPAVGDKYAIFNISMPDSYIADNATKSGASWQMFEECVKYFAENEKQKFSFTGELDGIWAKSQWLAIGGKILPGGYVDFSDPQFQPDGVPIRIVAIKDYVNKPHKPVITLSNAPIAASFSSGLGKLEADEVVTEGKRKEVVQFSKRQWRDAKETMSMLEESLLKFGSGINPITVRTMQMLVGDESLQFRFVNNKTAPAQVPHNVTFDKSNKQLTANAGIIQHMTLGIEKISPSHKASEYKYWDMAKYISPPLDENKAYYLYAKCSKSAQAGTFLLSESAIEIEAISGFYHLLMGVINSEIDNNRSVGLFYGFSEITPARITTSVLSSPDGGMYIDLLNKVIKGNIRFASGSKEHDLSDWATETETAIEGVQAEIDAAVIKATYWSIKASTPVIYKDANSATASGVHTPVTVTGELRSGTTTTQGGFISIQPNGGAETTATASPRTIAPTNAEGKTSYTVRLYEKADKVTLLDTMTIPVVFKGASGVNAINASLSNEADVLPASPEGVVSDYAGSGTIVRVFEGATELTYGTGNGQFQVSASGSGITVGTPSTVGNTRVYGVASNMTSDNATITFTISGKTSSGASFSLTKVQTFAKSRVGQKGSDGKSITLVDVEYAVNTSPTTPPIETSNLWKTLAGTLTGSQQLWTRTKTVYSSGNPTYSIPANITPKTGGAGADGNSITSITEWYYLSTSKTAPTGGSWSTTPWTWTNGMFMWTKTVFTYSKTADTETLPIVSSEWVAIEDYEKSSNNILVDSKFLNSNTEAFAWRYSAYHNTNMVDGNVRYTAVTSGNAARLERTLYLKKGSYTLSMRAKTNAPLFSIRARSFVNAEVTSTPNQDATNDFTVLSWTFYVFEDGDTTLRPYYREGLGIGDYLEVDWYAIVKGSNPMLDWKPSKEDAQLAITSLGGYMEGAFQDSVIDKAEAKAIGEHLKTINDRYVTDNALYYNLIDNPFLMEGAVRTTLLNEMQHIYRRDKPLLDTAINNIVNNKTVTTPLRTAFNTAFTNYRLAITSFQTAVEDARKAIEEQRVDNIEIGGRNLLLNSGIVVTNVYYNRQYITLTTPTIIGQTYTFSIKCDDIGDAILAIYDNTTGDKRIGNLSQIKGNIYGITFISVDAFEQIRIRNLGDTTNPISTYECQLEKGNKPTDWTLAPEDVQAAIDKAQADANVSLAKTKFMTEVDGGLIYSAMMKLYDAGGTGDEKAGISGIAGEDKDNPAFWAGGTYEQAIAFIAYLKAMENNTPSGTGAGQFNYAGKYPLLAPITMMHDGSGKQGDFIIERSGRIVMVDPATGKPRLAFSLEDLPAIDDLVAGVSSTGGITIGGATTYTTQTLSGVADITQPGGVGTVGEVTITVSGTGKSDPTGRGSFIEVSLVLYRGGTRVQTVWSSILSFIGSNYTTDSIDRTFTAREISLSGKGNHHFKLEVVKNGDIATATGTSTPFSFSWNASLAGIKRQQYGLDGMMFFYGDKHFYFTEEGGLDTRGAMNMPGVLASGTVSTGGGLSNEWGAKINYGQTITGGYRIFLKDMTHNKYSVQVTPHTNVTFRISTKTSTYFEILGTGAADFVVFGSNY